jgi:hypothetical protein
MISLSPNELGDLCTKHGIQTLKPNWFMISIEAWKKGSLQNKGESLSPFVGSDSRR